MFKSQGDLGRYIYVDLQFRNKYQLRIINCYISSSDSSLRNKTIVEVTKLLNHAKLNNMHVILLGDFNAVPNRRTNPSHSDAFFEQLDNNNIFNLFDLYTMMLM